MACPNKGEKPAASNPEKPVKKIRSRNIKAGVNSSRNMRADQGLKIEIFEVGLSHGQQRNP